MDTWIWTLPQRRVKVDEGSDNAGSAGRKQTSGAGRGMGMLLVAPGAAQLRLGVVLWAWDATFGSRWNEVRCASAVARSAMKVVVAALVMAGGRCAGRCCCRALDGRGWSS